MNSESSWAQDALFPNPAGSSLRIAIGMDQESGTLCCHTEIVKGAQKRLIVEAIRWYNFNENGLLSYIEDLWSIIREAEEDHGLTLSDRVVERIVAPF